MVVVLLLLLLLLLLVAVVLLGASNYDRVTHTDTIKTIS